MFIAALVIIGAFGVTWFTRRQRSTMSRDTFRVANWLGLGAAGFIALMVIIGIVSMATCHVGTPCS